MCSAAERTAYLSGRVCHLYRNGRLTKKGGPFPLDKFRGSGCQGTGRERRIDRVGRRKQTWPCDKEILDVVRLTKAVGDGISSIGPHDHTSKEVFHSHRTMPYTGGTRRL